MSTDLTRHDRPATDESSSLVFEAEIQYAPAPDAPRAASQDFSHRVSRKA